MAADTPDEVAVRRFVDRRVLAPAAIEIKHQEGMHPAEAGRLRKQQSRQVVNTLIVKRILHLIILLDSACIGKVGPAHCCLFELDSSIKSTKEMVRHAHVWGLVPLILFFTGAVPRPLYDHDGPQHYPFPGLGILSQLPLGKGGHSKTVIGPRAESLSNSAALGRVCVHHLFDRHARR
eukprot:scaffold106082_cov22-Tisochrysis_lutea.AAC.2